MPPDSSKDFGYHGIPAPIACCMVNNKSRREGSSFCEVKKYILVASRLLSASFLRLCERVEDAECRLKI
jgi:hypothetical protein